MVSVDGGDLSAGAPRVESALHVVQGQVVDDASNSSVTFDTDLINSNNDFYNNMELVFISGDNTGQVRRISDYVGATGYITVDTAFLDEPSAGESFYIIPRVITDLPTTSESEGYVENAADTTSTHNITTANDKTETQIFEVAKSGIYALSVWFDLDPLETANEGGTVTFRLFNKTDGTNYADQPIAEAYYVEGTSDEYPSFEADMVHEYCKVTVQCSDDVTTTRAITYRYITRDVGA